MAGSFGYEAGEHYTVSMQCAERVLLPAVRKASDDTLLIADGFSCREQISQATGRATLHLAEVLALALRRRVDRPAFSTNGVHDGVMTGRIVALAAASVLAGTAIITRPWERK